MDPIILFSLLGTSFSFVGILHSIFKILGVRKAEDTLVKLLSTDNVELEKIAHDLPTCTADQPVFQSALALIKKRLDDLNESDKKRIVEHLQQPSERDTVEYVKKIVEARNHTNS
jgi:hypothetical protein